MFPDMSSGQSDDAVPVDPGAWTDAGSRLVNRGIAVGDANLARRAVARFESVLAATSPGDANHAIAAAHAANALVIEIELTGRADALDRAITLLDDLGPDAAAFGPANQTSSRSSDSRSCATPSASRGQQPQGGDRRRLAVHDLEEHRQAASRDTGIRGGMAHRGAPRAHPLAAAPGHAVCGPLMDLPRPVRTRSKPRSSIRPPRRGFSSSHPCWAALAPARRDAPWGLQGTGSAIASPTACQ